MEAPEEGRLRLYEKEDPILSEILNQIPLKSGRDRFFRTIPIDFTCLFVLDSHHLIIGSSVGTVYWINRQKRTVRNLQCDKPLELTCIQACDSVEHLIAAGDILGVVTVFQIQKEHPPELEFKCLAHTRPNKKYRVDGLHRGKIKCLEWSKNGMKLFSADISGIVVLTELDQVKQVTKSYIILNETYEINQLSFHQSNLIVSSLYRTVICKPDGNSAIQWSIQPVGTQDKKLLSQSGAIFLKKENPPKILCSRFGHKLWNSNILGHVEHTFLFKNSLKDSLPEIELINPCKKAAKLSNGTYEHLLPYQSNFVVTKIEDILVVLNFKTIRIETICTKLRNIISLSTNTDEIFILESPRSIIRIVPHSPGSPTKIGLPVEICEPARADECFETLPEEFTNPDGADVFEKYVKFERIKLKKQISNAGIVEIGQEVQVEDDEDALNANLN